MRRLSKPALAGLTVLALTSVLSTPSFAQCGRASWYGPGFNGRSTANGERFNQGALTAAHKSLPFGTKVRVVNKKNGKSLVVRINDRGPFIKGRIIDLSKGAAQKLGFIQLWSCQRLRPKDLSVRSLISVWLPPSRPSPRRGVKPHWLRQ
jgi:rare lipoprotein A